MAVKRIHCAVPMQEPFRVDVNLAVIVANRQVAGIPPAFGAVAPREVANVYLHVRRNVAIAINAAQRPERLESVAWKRR